MKIGIPVLNRGDLLARLLRSIDVEARVLIVVNRIGPVDASVEAMVRESEREPLERLQIEVRWIEGNLGVAGSWNRILDEFGGDCWISNSDIAFGPGVLTEAMGQIEAHRSIVLHHLWAAACFYATAEFTRRLGWFDENFYPAYREDQEMALRSAALAVPRRIFAGIDPKRIVHGGSETIKSADERARRYIQHAHQLSGPYFAARWGRVPENGGPPEKKHPFDEPARHPADWTLDLKLRARIARQCEEITGHACPLLHHRTHGGLA